MEETLRDTNSTCGGHWLLQIAPSSLQWALPTPDNRFPSRARSVPSCTFLAMWFAALLGGGRQVFWDGVSGRGGCDPLAHGAKSVLLTLSKVSSGEYSQRLRGRDHPVPPFLRNPGRAGIQTVTWRGEPALPTVSRLSWAYLSYPDYLCLQVWLLPRIPAGGENLFSRRGLINACNL